MLTLWRGLSLSASRYTSTSTTVSYSSTLIFLLLMLFSELIGLIKLTMKKHLILALLSTLIFIKKSNSQVNSLSDFLYLSELSEYELTDYLQSNWELQSPTETIKNGKATSVYTFTYNYNQKKQVLKRVINMDLDTAYKIRSTTFISDDISFLERVEKSLSAKEFFEVGSEDRKKLYEDGNRMLAIERDFHKRAKGLYKITIMYKDDFVLYANRSKPESILKSDNVRVNQKWNIKGVKDDDLGTFSLKVYENWDCYIELYINGKLYKSSKCDSENETATLSNGVNTIKIKYATPELTDVLIDVLGNETKFDYVVNENALKQDTEIALPISKGLNEENERNNYGGISKAKAPEDKNTDREVVFKPINKGADCDEKGIVALEVVIDANGNYINSEISRRGTTNFSGCLLHKATELAKKHKWNKVSDTKNDNVRLEINFK